MKRQGPRPFGPALEATRAALEPATVLASVQACWREVAGDVVADEAEPVSEREGVVTVLCRSSVWAAELDLLGASLLEGLRERTEEGSSAPSLRGLRFVTTSPRRRL